MIASIPEYSNFEETTAMICSWNMDATKPDTLTESDQEKLHEWLHGMEDPDIIMIGIQEIVDLGSTAMTASKYINIDNNYNKKILTFSLSLSLSFALF